MKLISDFDLTPVTTFHVPASTRWYGEFKDTAQLVELLDCNELSELPVMFMGGGSNLLFARPYEGAILRSANDDITILGSDNGYRFINTGAGTNWDKFVKFTVDNGLYGAENLSYIPGETGASAVQNVGAYGVEAKDIIHSVHVYDTVCRCEADIPVSDCRYAYRDSMFKHCPSRYVVLDVTYRLSEKELYNLEYGPLKELKNDLALSPAKVRERVIEIRKSKLPDPGETGSAGSFFKNPVVDRKIFEELKSHYPDIPSYVADADRIKIPAGWLIEHAGLKGATEGGASVYQRQCLVIVNNGNATATDVINLSRRVIATVLEKFGVELSPEVNIIGL